METSQKKFNVAFVIVFALIGTILLIAGIFIIASHSNFKKTAIKTQAKIVYITSHRHSDGDVDHSVYVEFKVDDKIYSGNLGFYSSNMKTGKYVDIYYNPSNPSDFKSSSIGILGIIFIGLGTIFYLVSLREILKPTTHNKKQPIN